MELRELEAKLKAGYMNRERAAQLAEKRLLEIDEQVSQNSQILDSNSPGTTMTKCPMVIIVPDVKVF